MMQWTLTKCFRVSMWLYRYIYIYILHIYVAQYGGDGGGGNRRVDIMRMAHFGASRL